MVSAQLSQLSHGQRVRVLYKTCLRLHRGLPDHMRSLGDVYLRDEFKRHRDVKDQGQVNVFLQAWTKYALTLSQQLGPKHLNLDPANLGEAAGKNTDSKTVGQALKEDDINLFTGEQIVQLHELYKEASKQPS